jgi:hypothetical protein
MGLKKFDHFETLPSSDVGPTFQGKRFIDRLSDLIKINIRQNGKATILKCTDRSFQTMVGMHG